MHGVVVDAIGFDIQITDAPIYINNIYIAENESDMPPYPAGMF
jgi:hypothetical protein